MYNEMAGLCPLYVSVSEHEVCLDENKEVIDKADFLQRMQAVLNGLVAGRRRLKFTPTCTQFRISKHLIIISHPLALSGQECRC